MLTNPTNVYTKDEELIKTANDIFQWIIDNMSPSDVNLKSRTFIEDTIENVETFSEFISTRAFDTSMFSNVTFFIKNTGNFDAIVKLQIGPTDNEEYYTDDGVNINVAPGDIKPLVPMIFAKYTRILYKSNDSNSTNLDIIMQGHI